MPDYILKTPYNKGSYNKMNDKEQYIRLTEGCPNKCPYCAESFENGINPIYLEIPKIIRNDVKIFDMNLIYKPKALEIINFLGSQKVNHKIVYYHLICGIDHRYLTEEIAVALKTNHFYNIRIAWDHNFSDQKIIRKAIKILTNAGYKAKTISIFILCDYKTTYKDCIKKLDLLKIWNVKVNDCYFDNVTPPNYKCFLWTIKECKKFRRMCRKHNQMINFEIDPEIT